MSDETHWWKAYAGVVGLRPEPWDMDETMGWPTEGFDGNLYEHNRDWDETDTPFKCSGHTREEWLQLADEMIRRWTAWRAHVAALPPE